VTTGAAPGFRSEWGRGAAILLGPTAPLHERLALPLVGLGVAVGATNLLCMKASFQAGFRPVGFGALRFLAVGLAALVWLRARGLRAWPAEPEARRWLLREALAKCLGAAGIYTAVFLLPASTVLVLGFCHPFMQMLLAGKVLEDRVEGRRALAMGLGTVALLLYALTRDHQASAGGSPLPGMALCLVGLVGTSFMGVASKRATRAGADPLHSVLATSLLPALAWGPAAWLLEGFPGNLPGTAWAWALFAYACSVAGILLFAYRRWLLRHYRVSFLASFSPVARSLAIALTVLVLGEHLPWRAVAVLAAAGLLSGLAGRRSAGARAG